MVAVSVFIFYCAQHAGVSLAGMTSHPDRFWATQQTGQFLCRNTIQLAHLQADELWAKMQGQTLSIATAFCVLPTALCLGCGLTAAG